MTQASGSVVERQGWPAPMARGPIRGTVSIPGSKSQTNRALILAAQANAQSTVTGALRSRDTELMAAGLSALGVGVDTSGEDWLITPARPHGPARVDCGLAGTVMRFLPPFAATGSGVITIDGDPAARVRPMGTVLGALRSLGAEISGDGLPFVLRGTGSLIGGTVTIDASASSQFVSGLLLSAPSFDNGVTVRHDGKPVPSLPHIDMTVQALRSVGAVVQDSDANTWRVEPGPLRPFVSPIEPDLSNATPFLAAAIITGGSVSVRSWPMATIQAGDAFRGIAEQFGATVNLTAAGLRVTAPDRLSGIDINLHDVSELTPTVAAMALFADGPSHLRGIGHIRGHETDRIAALENNIRSIGGKATSDEDSLHIEPVALHGGPWTAYADHRMATAGAIVGLGVDGIEVDDIDCTAKTLPGFAGMWSDLLAITDGPRP